MAGNSAAQVFHAISRESASPKLETPNRSTVTATTDKHPDSQCRLDTYVQGAMCPVDDRLDLSNTNERQGV